MTLENRSEDTAVAVDVISQQIFRLYAPDPPYNDDVLREIFRLYINTVFKGIQNPRSGTFARCHDIADSSVQLRLCMMFLDLNSEPLILEMIETLIKCISPELTIDAQSTIRSLLVMVIEFCRRYVYLKVELEKPVS